MTEPSSKQGSLEVSLTDERQALRLWLARFLKVMAWLMLLGFIYWCLAGLGSDQQTKVESYQVDVSAISVGQHRALSVGKQPLVIVHRSEEQLASLSSAHLNDADSWQNNDPGGIETVYRGAVAQWLVVEALGTELNCPVDVKPAGGSFQGRPWPGGFADKCRDQRYDWAGRVYADQGAKRNLRVMHYSVVAGPSLAISLR